jgi:hypothetical protein
VRRLAWLVVLLGAAWGPGAALSQESVRCGGDDKDCAARALAGHAVTKLAYWQPVLYQPMERRIGAAPPELIEYLALDNIKNGYPNRPRPASVPEDFLRDVRAAMAEIPAAVRRLMRSKLAGIHFVEDLGGTGYTDQVFDARARAVAGFVVLDQSVLARQTANAWATWKENTPFRADPRFRLEAGIEHARGDDRKNAIQYILLHELGHVLAIGGKFHPDWNLPPREVANPAGYPFFRLSWRVAREENRYATPYDAAFPQRERVVYYFGARLAADEMVATYASLERTNFVTLYAATHPADDFAEAFASYVHTVLMKKPFEIRLYVDGAVAQVYRSCWSEARCAAKRKILEELLKGR